MRPMALNIYTCRDRCVPVASAAFFGATSALGSMHRSLALGLLGLNQSQSSVFLACSCQGTRSQVRLELDRNSVANTLARRSTAVAVL